MAELVDALDSKSSSRKGVRVRFSLGAPKLKILFSYFSETPVATVLWLFLHSFKNAVANLLKR